MCDVNMSWVNFVRGNDSQKMVWNIWGGDVLYFTRDLIPKASMELEFLMFIDTFVKQNQPLG